MFRRDRLLQEESLNNRKFKMDTRFLGEVIAGLQRIAKVFRTVRVTFRRTIRVIRARQEARGRHRFKLAMNGQPKPEQGKQER